VRGEERGRCGVVARSSSWGTRDGHGASTPRPPLSPRKRQALRPSVHTLAAPSAAAPWCHRAAVAGDETKRRTTTNGCGGRALWVASLIPAAAGPTRHDAPHDWGGDGGATGGRWRGGCSAWRTKAGLTACSMPPRRVTAFSVCGLCGSRRCENDAATRPPPVAVRDGPKRGDVPSGTAASHSIVRITITCCIGSFRCARPRGRRRGAGWADGAADAVSPLWGSGPPPSPVARGQSVPWSLSE